MFKIFETLKKNNPHRKMKDLIKYFDDVACIMWQHNIEIPGVNSYEYKLLTGELEDTYHKVCKRIDHFERFYWVMYWVSIGLVLMSKM